MSNIKEICEDYNYAKKTYSMKGIEDEHKIHWLDMMTAGLWGYGMQGVNWTLDSIISDKIEAKPLKNINQWAKANRASGEGQENY